jgi:hypothetical protein
MAGLVGFTDVGLGLYDEAAQPPAIEYAYQLFAQKIPRHLQGGLPIEVTA